MNNVFVYCEMEGKHVADVSLELLTKGRKLIPHRKPVVTELYSPVRKLVFFAIGIQPLPL